MAAEKWLEVGVLHQMSGGVGGGQRHGDDEVGGGEARAAPGRRSCPSRTTSAAPAWRSSLHRSGSPMPPGGRPAARRAGSAPPAPRVAIGEISAGGERGDARLIAEGGEVVDAGQAHDLPPSVGLLASAAGSDAVPGGLGCSSRTPFINHDRRPRGAGLALLQSWSPCS